MTCNFRERLAAAAAYPDECFAAFLLANDIAGSKLGREQRDQAIAGSLACGAAVAAKLAEEAGLQKWTQPASDIACRLGVAVVAAPDLPGPMLLLSCYEPRKRLITLNRRAMSRLEEAAALHGLADLLGPFAAAEVAVAHELFHYVEAGDCNLFPRRYRITLWRIGPFKYQSRLPALSEIAAMACAKALCRLTFNPLLLEAVLLEAAEKGQGMAWLDRLDEVT